MVKNNKIEWVKVWEGRPYPPFLMVPCTKATVFDFAKLFSKSQITRGGNYWHNGKNIYFYLDNEFGRTIKFLAEQSIKQPKFLYDFFKIAFDKAKKLNKFSSKYLKRDIAKISSNELIGFLETFSYKFIDMYRYATVSALMGYRQDNPLYLKADQILHKKTRSCPEKFADYLIALTSPNKKLKINQQEGAILELALKVKARGLKTPADVKKYFAKELKLIYDKFSFLSFDFSNVLGWDLDHYARLVASKIKLDIKWLIKENNNREQMINSNFNKISNNLRLITEEIKIFDLIRNLGFYKWAREYEFQEALYRAKFIQDELGRRCGLLEIEAKYLLPVEFKKALRNPMAYKKISQGRIKNFLVLSQRGKGTIFLENNLAAKEYSDIKFIKENIKNNVNEIKGVPAYAGQAAGRVKIINNVKELIKMKKGDILISRATSPDLLSAMKKAAAIVTDEGGITCHAAIVSRELKIPCVVGTKIATKIFKDGDKVKVDAVKGIVKKV